MQGRNGSVTRRHNLEVVAGLIRRNGPLSRQRLSELGNLGPATMTNLVGQLSRDGFVREVGKVPARGSEGGRSQVLLDIATDRWLVAGAHVGVRLITVSLGDLKGRPVGASVTMPRHGAGAVKTASSIDELVRSAIANTGVGVNQILGLGVAIVAPVDPIEGTVPPSAELGWPAVAFRGIVEKATGMPVQVDNTRRAMMMSERLFGQAQHARNAVLVHVGTTIGAGLLLENRVYIGSSHRAAQLGHVRVLEGGPRCTCGGFGCLDVVAGEDVLARRAGELYGDSRPLRTIPGTYQYAVLERLYRAALRSEPGAVAIVQEAAAAIGAALENLLLILDPEVVIVAGTIQAAGPVFFEALKATVDAHVKQVLGRTPEIVPSKLGLDIRIHGAIALAAERLFYGSPTDESASLRKLGAPSSMRLLA